MNQSGRSMVEMLGVLAIIGVLSVGAITGYSKAMLKYRLNKQSQQISELLNYGHIFSRDFQPTDKPSNGVVDIGINQFYVKLGWIPDGVTFLKLSNTSYRLFDIFQNAIGTQYVLSKSARYMYTTIELSKADTQTEQCYNLLSTFQQLPDFLDSVSLRLHYIDGSSKTPFELHGNSYCTEKSTYCLKTLTMKQIGELCTEVCQDSDYICRLMIVHNQRVE